MICTTPTQHEFLFRFLVSPAKKALTFLQTKMKARGYYGGETRGDKEMSVEEIDRDSFFEQAQPATTHICF
jgi:hypothetical protein